MFDKYKKNITLKNMFVDSTIIQNYNCYKIISKKQIKITVICNNNKIVIKNHKKQILKNVLV
jgi:hypothetical protein